MKAPTRVVLCHEFGSSCCPPRAGLGPCDLPSSDPSPPLKLTCTFGENSRQRGSEVWRNPHHSGHGSDCVGLWFSPQTLPTPRSLPSLSPKTGRSSPARSRAGMPDYHHCVVVCSVDASGGATAHVCGMSGTPSAAEIERSTTTRGAPRGKTTRRDFCIWCLPMLLTGLRFYRKHGNLVRFISRMTMWADTFVDRLARRFVGWIAF